MLRLKFRSKQSVGTAISKTLGLKSRLNLYVRCRVIGFVKVKSAVVAAVTTVALSLSLAIVADQPAKAADANNFNAGNIISDTMFYNIRMSEADIQAFLSRNGSWLANYRQTTVTKPVGVYADGGNATGWGVCYQYDGAADELASTIIFKVQNACGVSAQALLVTLQKESSLVTSGTSQWLSQAMGYACSDSSACETLYYGFFNQMYGAARSFQWYGNQAPGSYSSKKYAVGWWNVQFKPYSNCGTKSIYVENRATAALYYYTPYTPNQAALSNLYGLGDSCSSYGNRNFWRIFTDWFGSTQIIPGSIQFITAAYRDVLGRAPESSTVVQNWAAAMAGGLSRTSMANAFNNSEEYRAKRINEAYQAALGRAPDSGGFAFWMSSLRGGALSPEDLYSTFLYSNEMYSVQGGGTDAGYVTALYRALLGRDPDPVGLQYWTAQLGAGASRKSISDGFWYSPEKYLLRVEDAFQLFLGRSASQPEREYWASVARTRGPTAMRSGIMSSEEYWIRASSRF